MLLRSIVEQCVRDAQSSFLDFVANIVTSLIRLDPLVLSKCTGTTFNYNHVLRFVRVLPFREQGEHSVARRDQEVVRADQAQSAMFEFRLWRLGAAAAADATCVQAVVVCIVEFVDDQSILMNSRSCGQLVSLAIFTVRISHPGHHMLLLRVS